MAAKKKQVDEISEPREPDAGAGIEQEALEAAEAAAEEKGPEEEQNPADFVPQGTRDPDLLKDVDRKDLVQAALSEVGHALCHLDGVPRPQQTNNVSVARRKLRVALDCLERELGR